MKILMFGRGTVATQYGWAFEKAGHTVDFYVRPGRMATYGPEVSLNLLDLRTKFSGVKVLETWPIQMIEDVPPDHDYDLIIVSVQHYRFQEVVDYLESRLGKATLLIFTNFWAEPEAEVAKLPSDQLVWGFPGAGGGFSDNTLNGVLFGHAYFGTFNPTLSAREREARNLFTQSGFKLAEKKDFRSWLLAHFAMNAGIHTETLRVGSGLKVFSSSRHARNAILNTRELFGLLEAREVDLNQSELALYKMPLWLGALAMGLSGRFYPPLKHMLENHSNREELKAFVRDVVTEARRLEVATPRLEKAANLTI